jgi:hypothetical protein
MLVLGGGTDGCVFLEDLAGVGNLKTLVPEVLGLGVGAVGASEAQMVEVSSSAKVGESRSSGTGSSVFPEMSGGGS